MAERSVRPPLTRLQGTGSGCHISTTRLGAVRRARSLLTGLHPHQTGIGILTNNDAPAGYPGSLNDLCATVAEVLKVAGYTTFMAGKWHLASRMDSPCGAWPTRRGFDRFFGTLTGCGSYYQPGTLLRGEADALEESLEPGFLYTDAIADESVSFVRDHCSTRPEQPFFLYMAYTAPHWPLHAPEEDIRAYDHVFEDGWDVLRERRIARLVEQGLFPERDKASGRDPTQPAWRETKWPEWQLRRMQTYAAQVERMDRGVGRLVATLSALGELENTLLIFLSDNGASPEDLPLWSPAKFSARADILPRATRKGRPIRVGNSPGITPGPEDTYASYGRTWANLSNTPFRYYKRWVHEGGIAAPFVAHWPAASLPAGAVCHNPFQLTDVVPTLLEAAGASYPEEIGHRAVLPLEGTSMLAALRGGTVKSRPLFWEHTGNAAVRSGQWKLVRQFPGPWELYDIDSTPAETVDLAKARPTLVRDLSEQWRNWAGRVGVIPWEVTLDIYRRRGFTDEEAAG